MTRKDIFDFLRPGELLHWASDLVAIPSYSGLENQEAAVGRYLKSVFDREGIECRLAPLPHGRCNVYARLPGTGGGKSLMLNGHMDTVPAYGMERAFEPWLDAEGRLHGRGTSDMKGPLAAMLAALVALRRSGARLRGDLLYCAVADEEEGSLGTIHMIEDGIRADGAVVGEPLGENAIAITQKGLEWFEFDFQGRTVHGGAYREGVSAIQMAVRFINALNAELVPKLAARVLPVAGESTLNIGVIRGGTQLSTVAGECCVQLDRRFLPQTESYEQCCAELRAIVGRLAAEDPKFRCTMKVLESSVMEKGYVHQGFLQTADDPFVRSVAGSFRTALGREPQLVGCPCWTDGGLIAHYAHMPVVVYGPGRMDVSHSREEYILPAWMEESCQVYLQMAADFCGLEEHV